MCDETINLNQRNHPHQPDQQVLFLNAGLQAINHTHLTMLLPPDKKEDEAAAEAAAARLQEQARRREGRRHSSSGRRRRNQQRRDGRDTSSPNEAAGSGSRFHESFDFDDDDDDDDDDSEESASSGGSSEEEDNQERSRRRRHRSSRSPTSRSSANRRAVIRERDSEVAAAAAAADAVAPVATSSSRRPPPRRHHHHHHRHRHYNTLTPIPSSPLTSEASSETDPLLLPPPYSEAETGLKRRNRRKLYLTIASALIGAIVVALLTSTYVEYRDELRRRRGGWVRGGVDGNGRWGSEWHHATPLLSDETEPRSCDMFSEPIAADRRDLPSTSPTIYMTSAYFELPRSLKKLKIRGRGAALSGSIFITPGSTETSWNPEAARNKTQSEYLIRVEAHFVDANTMKEWHVCQFGHGDDQGIVVVGPEGGGGNPITSPWKRGYLRMNVFIDVPRDRLAEMDLDFDLDDENDDFSIQPTPEASHTPEAPLDSTITIRKPTSPAAGTRNNKQNTHGDLLIDSRFMTIAFVGDFIQMGIVFDNIEVRSDSGPIQADSLAANDIEFAAERSVLSVTRLEARDGVMILVTSGEPIFCRRCTGSNDILLHNSRGWIGGHYEAQVGIDVFTTEFPIEGYYHASKVWVRNSNARVDGAFEGIRYANGTGGLLVQTTNDNIVARVALAADVDAYARSSGDTVPSTDGDDAASAATSTTSPPMDPILVRLMTPSGDLSMNLTHIDPGVVTHISLGTGNGHAQSILAPEFQGDIAISDVLSNKIFVDQHEPGGRDRLITRRPDGYQGDTPYWLSSLSGRVNALKKYDGDDDGSRKSGWCKINYDTSPSDMYLTL